MEEEDLCEYCYSPMCGDCGECESCQCYCYEYEGDDLTEDEGRVVI